jgi:hypothetical protein
MAKKRRGRYVPVWNVRVKAKGKNLELTFRIPAEAVREVSRHIQRFVERTKSVKRSKAQLSKG